MKFCHREYECMKGVKEDKRENGGQIAQAQDILERRTQPTMRTKVLEDYGPRMLVQ